MTSISVSQATIGHPMILLKSSIPRDKQIMILIFSYIFLQRKNWFGPTIFKLLMLNAICFFNHVLKQWLLFRRDGEQELFNIIGPIFVLVQFLGIRNCTSTQPFIVTERTVLYREMFAGMYSSWAYSLAQVTIEIPYILLQSLLFVTITYPAINFYWSAYKIIWYFYSMFCTLLYFNYFGMLVVSLSTTFEVASVLTGLCFTLMGLFTFIIPGPQIPKWRVWSYWICPIAWSIKGLVTSQYGDINKEISVFGEPKAINAFLKSYYGYHQENLGVAAFVLFSLPLVFALAFAFFIVKLNFQRG